MLALGTWILLVATSIVSVIYVYMTILSRKRRPGEPPVAKGSLIWGNAKEFGTHAVNFLHKCQDSYGNVFTLRLLNQHLTIIMDPHSYEDMSRTRNFDFDPIQKQVNSNVFGFVLNKPDQMIKDTAKTVRGDALRKGMTHFVDNLQDSYEHMSTDFQVQDKQWHSEGLREFASKTMFKSIFNTLFGKSSNQHAFNAGMAHKNFDIFHKYFNLFWLGLPKCLFPAATKALKELLVMPSFDEMMARDDIADFMRHSIQFMKDQGQSEYDIKAHNLVYLHVNYNTFRVSFWALNNLLEHAEACAAVTEEINNAIADRLDPETNTAALTMKDVESLKVLDSFLNETLRLSSGVFMVRYVKEDTVFKTSDGKEHLMRQGDRVAMYPPAIHKDPSIFKDPMEFKYDRFVDNIFYKDNKPIQHPVNAFGSLCPGKRYATLQLKWYIMSVLSKFDMKLQDGQHAQYAYEYHGHEVLPPKKDVQFDFKLKDSHPTLEFVEE